MAVSASPSSLLHPLVRVSSTTLPRDTSSIPRLWMTTSLSPFGRLFVNVAASTISPLPALRSPTRRSTALVVFARRRKSSSAPTQGVPSKHKKFMIQKDEKENDVEDDIDEDAFEALFSQLEEDLKNDDILGDDDSNEITEEDLAKLEQELEEAFSEGDFANILDDSPSSSDSLNSDVEDDEEVRRPVLKNWQLRRLARALKIGRRKTSIKSLAAELGLDRAFVLELLRDPSPNLLLMSASLPDEVAQAPESERIPLPDEVTQAHEADSEPLTSPLTITIDDAESRPEVKLPVHVMRSRWSAQKRLKKVQVTTLEKVYSRTKRPTNAMISSIIRATNLPWQTVVKWFEDKRLQDGVPQSRVPFRRSMHDNISPS